VIGRCSSVEHMSCLPPRYLSKSNKSTPLLSVVVPVGPLVGRMDNLLSWIVEIQSYSAQVILVVDEKSDGTYSELLKKLIAIDFNTELLLINEICGGPGVARNRGLSEAKGDWLVFWDSDDLPEVSETFKAISQAGEESNVIVCEYAVLRKDFKQEYPKLDYIQMALNPGIWRFIFRREIFKDFSFPNLKLAEDQVYLITSRVFSNKLVLHPEVNYRYIFSGDQQLTNRRENDGDLLVAISALRVSQLVGRYRRSLESSFRAVVLMRLLLTAVRRIEIKDILLSLGIRQILQIVLSSLPSFIYLRLLRG
jgi:glycosyltransferase involved in cell wall biosynthesis